MAVGIRLHEFTQHLRCVPVFSPAGSLERFPEFLFDADAEAYVLAWHGVDYCMDTPLCIQKSSRLCRISPTFRDTLP